MSRLVALIYPDVSIPAETYGEINRLQVEGRLDVMDLTEVEIKQNGKLRFERAMTLPMVGHSEGLFLPALVGILFFNPQHTGNDNVQRTLADISLDQTFMKNLEANISPRYSILFLYLRDDVSPHALKLISQHGVKMLQLSLSSYQESKLEQLFRGHSLGDRESTVVHAP